jgi:hypothetical protein
MKIYMNAPLMTNKKSRIALPGRRHQPGLFPGQYFYHTDFKTLSGINVRKRPGPDHPGPDRRRHPYGQQYKSRSA